MALSLFAGIAVAKFDAVVTSEASSRIRFLAYSADRQMRLLPYSRLRIVVAGTRSGDHARHCTAGGDIRVKLRGGVFATGGLVGLLTAFAAGPTAASAAPPPNAGVSPYVIVL
jgi:hypothetical protein